LQSSLDKNIDRKITVSGEPDNKMKKSKKKTEKKAVM
jgi:hypothetical protein